MGALMMMRVPSIIICLFFVGGWRGRQALFLAALRRNSSVARDVVAEGWEPKDPLVMGLESGGFLI